MNGNCTTFPERKLNKLYRTLRDGQPISSEDLAELGISCDLAVYYVRAGWLTRLSRGVFCRPGPPLDLNPSLRFLENRMEGLHVGGKTALDWHGVRQHLAHQPKLRLYGWTSKSLPTWFTDQFPTAAYHRLRLFDEPPLTPLRVAALGGGQEPRVSAPERAVLELLSEVGVRQPLQEAREIMETVPFLRAAVLQELLRVCRQVKTVRLCLMLGREFGHPWADKLDTTQLPTSGSRWIGKTREGLLIL